MGIASMIATGSSAPEGAPRAPWLIRIGVFTAFALAAMLAALLWTILLTDAAPTGGALVAAAFGASAAFAGAFLIRRIILDLAEREKQAARDAGHDLLSGLANRKLFEQWIDYELARHRRENTHFALMYLDIDHFKDINDRHGHDAGDRMIKAAAQRIAGMLRPTDRLARFGGDEFAILQSGVRTIRDAEALASRIVEAMRACFALGSAEVATSVSIGIALCPDNAAERDDLMQLADLALYRAKKEGRDRIAFFDARMGEELALRRRFGAELGDAIAAGALALDFQPVFAATDRRLVGAEARLRWPHPQRGMIGVRDFMDVAEERGLLTPLFAWTLREACAVALDWNGVRLCVSVPSAQFNRPDFAQQTLHILHGEGFDPARLDLAIEEDCILEPKTEAMAGMQALRREGVRFTLAHYGAGVASLAHVRRFPFTRIKLDRACLDLSPGMTDNAAVLHAVIHLGRALGLTIGADGLEQIEQARYLAALGCHEVQGPLLCRYVASNEIENMLAAPRDHVPGAA